MVVLRSLLTNTLLLILKKERALGLFKFKRKVVLMQHYVMTLHCDLV